MKIQDIKARSRKEEDYSNLHLAEKNKYIGLILDTIKEYPNGYDIIVPSYLGSLIEEYCDLNKIPCCEIYYDGTELTLSVAKSYLQLEARERAR